MRSAAIAALGFSLAAPAAAQQPAPQNGWFTVPSNAVYTTGDTWTSGGETYRLYGIQSCLRGTHFTNPRGVRIDCGEASLTMLVAMIRDLRPQCYKAASQPSTKTYFVLCVAQPTTGKAAGSRIDLGTALVSTGWAFAAVKPDGHAVHVPYMVAQAVAQKAKAGLWQFPDTPDPNAIILKTIRQSASGR